MPQRDGRDRRTPPPGQKPLKRNEQQLIRSSAYRPKNSIRNKKHQRFAISSPSCHQNSAPLLNARFLAQHLFNLLLVFNPPAHPLIPLIRPERPVRFVKPPNPTIRSVKPLNPMVRSEISTPSHKSKTDALETTHSISVQLAERHHSKRLVEEPCSYLNLRE